MNYKAPAPEDDYEIFVDLAEEEPLIQALDLVSVIIAAVCIVGLFLLIVWPRQ